MLEKEFILFWRERENWLALFLYPILVYLLLKITLAAEVISPVVLAALLWLALLLAAEVLAGRTMQKEWEGQTWQALAAGPLDPGLFFLAKFLINLLMLFLVTFLLLALNGLEQGLKGGLNFLYLGGLSFLGAWNLAALGTFLAALLLNNRWGNLLLPLLYWPLLLPVLLGIVQLTGFLLAGEDPASPWWDFLLASGALFFFLPWGLFHLIMEV